jgi:vitamin B12 transporter
MNTFIRCTPPDGRGAAVLFAAVNVLISAVVFAQASGGELETVVTATRTETPASHIGSSVTVISAEELKINQYEWVSEALRQVPGVDVVRNGGFGGVTSVFIRGANSNHTLALVDGIEIEDPSTINAVVDFADIPPDNVDRIEVLRGPASSLYGSDPIGGVVNIITREGSGPPRFSFIGEGGTYQTVNGLISASGGSKWVNYSLSASSIRSDGINTSPLQTRPYLRSNLTAKLSTAFLDNWKVSLVTRYLNSRTNIDDIQNGQAMYDPNYISRVEQVLMRPELRGSLFDGFWKQTLGFSWNHTARSVDNLPDIVNPSSSTGRFLGIKSKLDWQHELRLFSGNDALVLGEIKEDIAQTSSSFSGGGFTFSNTFPRTSVCTYAITVEDRQQLFNSLYLTASGRWDHHDLFGDVLTQTVAVAYEIAPTGTRLHATEGTGFKAPSILQLYDPQYGNPDLQPERSASFDVGFDQSFFQGAFSVGATFFGTQIKHLIGFDPRTFVSININSAHISGVESYARFSQGGFQARVDYTWQKPIDQSNGSYLLRRPRNKVAAEVRESIAGFVLGGRLTYVGARDDIDFTTFPATQVSLDPYALLAFTAQYQLTRQVSLFGRVENALNEHYEEVRTFPVPARTIFLGARADL